MNAHTTSLAGLLSLQNEEFVDSAYDAILGRDPDDEGRAYYVARLRTGYSKLSVLGQLRSSDEPLLGPGVPGLARAISRYRLGRLPLIGWMVRKLFRVKGESVNERLQRAILSEIAALRSAMAGRPSMPIVAPARPQALSQPNVYNNAPSGRRNIAAEQLSPRAREIFEKLVSG